MQVSVYMISLITINIYGCNIKPIANNSICGYLYTLMAIGIFYSSDKSILKWGCRWLVKWRGGCWVGQLWR